MTPAELTVAARTLMAQEDPATAGVWPRACALAGRQALEAALDDLWASTARTAGLVDCSARTQLLCACAYLDHDLAGRVAWTWAALSRGCHFHGYELAPTAAELNRCLDDAEDLMARIAHLKNPASTQP